MEISDQLLQKIKILKSHFQLKDLADGIKPQKYYLDQGLTTHPWTFGHLLAFTLSFAMGFSLFLQVIYFTTILGNNEID